MKTKDDTLLHWRKEFPILERKTYLISNSLGAMPKSVFKKMNEYAETWSTKGVSAWNEDWWDMPVRTGNEIAPLIGAGNEEISMHSNITTILAIVLSCFEGTQVKGKRKIVCEELNFPSLIYLLREWTRTHSYELELVPSDDNITIDTERMLDAIDEETLLVPISHVLFKSAYIQEVQEIIKKAQSVGAYVFLDAYQSVGVLPLNVRDLGVDFLAGGVLKWLCGGPGGCFLYVRPDLSESLRPRLTGWFAHAEPFAFPTEEIKHATSSRKFLSGTPSIPGLYASLEGVKIIKSIGVDHIREKSIRQTSLIYERARENNWTVNSPRLSSQRGGAVTVDLPNALGVCRELGRRDMLVDYRVGAGVRIAPHFYTEDRELEYCFDHIKDILTTKTYERHAENSMPVT